MYDFRLDKFVRILRKHLNARIQDGKSWRRIDDRPDFG